MLNFNMKVLDFDWVVYSINKFSLIDVFDILIVAYFIYKIPLWIKETRAWSLFKGISIIIVISALSFLLGLTTIWWIVKTTINVGILALIIIFQPELRRALEEIGTGRLASLLNNTDEKDIEVYKTYIDEILKSTRILSSNGTGALIILERDVALGEIEQTGIKLDAIVTAPLLVNIFQDKTPLHDGAVVIKNNRIIAASCILPLTVKEIGKELGTRHRAAVGVTEVSDCYVLIISEETKAISIAHKGKIHLNLSQEEIRETLIDNRTTTGKKKFTLWRGSNEKN